MAADSQVRLWAASDDFITLSYAWARVRLSNPGERITDRMGLVHRVSPGTEGYPVALTIGLDAGELLEMNNAGATVHRSVLEWLEFYCRKQAALVAYLRGETLAVDGSPLSRLLAYTVYIEELPEDYFGTLPAIGGGPESIELRLLITEDGTFGNFDTLGSYSAYSPARP
ncbi:MAG TPA: hypothetical protein ENO21_02930 [Firmicutes bacterium]|nr:hypothetical protein [Bacillota bacterium]